AMFFLVFYLQIVRGFSALQAGALLLPFAAAQLIFAPVSARMVARFGGRRTATVSMLAVAAALAGYALLDTGTPVPAMLAVFFVQGAAMANIMPPATTAIMESLPREKAGVGSARSNTVRQVAGALGVAVPRSLLSSVSRGEIAPALVGLPAGVRHPGGESITATSEVARALGERGESMMSLANEAFVHSMHVTSLVSAGIALLGAAVVARWMPGKPRPVAQPEQKEPAIV